jgi:hypothetical protein
LPSDQHPWAVRRSGAPRVGQPGRVADQLGQDRLTDRACVRGRQAEVTESLLKGEVPRGLAYARALQRLKPL